MGGCDNDWRSNVLFAPIEILVPGTKSVSVNFDTDAVPASVARHEGREGHEGHGNGGHGHDEHGFKGASIMGNEEPNMLPSIPLLFSNTPLSFWGGIDPLTSQIVDVSHPLGTRPAHGPNGDHAGDNDEHDIGGGGTLVKDSILCLPSGRGSCTASQAMIELILNDTAPGAILLREVDGILCTGALVAREVFGEEVLGNNGVVGDSCGAGADGGKVPLIGKILDRDERDWAHMPSFANHNCNGNHLKSLFDAIGQTKYVHSSIFVLPHNQVNSETGQEQVANMAVLVASNSKRNLHRALHYLQCHPRNGHSLFPSISSHSIIITTTTTTTPNTTTSLSLTPEDISIVKGTNPNYPTMAHTLAMKIILQLAQITKATKLQPVSRAHIDGCTYVGEGGRRFVRRLVQLSNINNGNNEDHASDGNNTSAYARTTVTIPTTLNSISTDYYHHGRLGIPDQLSTYAKDVADAYMELGCNGMSFTCAPYLIDDFCSIDVGEHVVWGESNAVVYANSILGGRTNKTPDYLDICAALVGRVPYTGVHIDKERCPSLILDARDIFEQCKIMVECGTEGIDLSNHNLLDDNDAKSDDLANKDGAWKAKRTMSNWDSIFPVLGYICGNLSDGKVPLILLFDPPSSKTPLETTESSSSWHHPTKDDLKAFCAAFGTTGTAPLFHMAGVTPEARDENIIQSMMNSCKDSIKAITWEDLMTGYHTLNGGGSSGNSNGEESYNASVTDGKNTKEEKDHDDNEAIDLVALGNPHLSLSECKQLATLMTHQMSSSIPSPVPTTIHTNNDKPILKKHPNTRIIATLGRRVHEQASALGYISTLRNFGVEFINDTCWCMLLDPPVIPPAPNGLIMTNSAKYAHYGPGLTGRTYRFGGLRECVDAAVLGHRVRANNVTTDSMSNYGGTGAGHGAFPPWWLSRQTRSYFVTKKLEKLTPSHSLSFSSTAFSPMRWRNVAIRCRRNDCHRNIGILSSSKGNEAFSSMIRNCLEIMRRR